MKITISMDTNEDKGMLDVVLRALAGNDAIPEKKDDNSMGQIDIARINELAETGLYVIAGWKSDDNRPDANRWDASGNTVICSGGDLNIMTIFHEDENIFEVMASRDRINPAAVGGLAGYGKTLRKAYKAFLDKIRSN